MDISGDIEGISGLPVGVETVKRRLRAAGLYGRRPARKPLISEKNRKARLGFARKYERFTVADWSKVVFSDESKFVLFGNPGSQYVRRPKGSRFDKKYQQPTVKHGGGSVMVWGAFSARGTFPLTMIEGKLTGERYARLLGEAMLPHFNELPVGTIFQQDNDPKHTSRVAKAFFQLHQVSLLDWPAQSPDLNPIEHMWEELSRRCAKKRAKNAVEKFAILKGIWESIDQETISKLVGSMPRRIKAVIEADGWATKY